MGSIRSAAVWALTWAYMALAGLFALPWVLLTGRLGFIYAAARLGVRLLLRLAGVRVQVRGAPRPPGGGACLYMANHQSNLDPPILVTQLPGYISFLAKRELFRVPLLGAVFRVGGLIPVDRSNRATAQASIARAAAALQSGRPFLVFPEGTRSPDGNLLPFKKGPFFLAEQAEVPVIAVSIEGTGALMPRGQWRIQPGTVRLTFHPPILPEQWRGAPAPRPAIAEAVRARLAQT